MRVAKDRGHRLSDVVIYASKQLASLRLTNAFAYIRALLQKPTDYAYLAKQRDEQARQESEAAERRRAREEREDQLRAYIGSTFESADGALVREDPDGVKASTPFGHASAVVTAIVGGMMRRVPHDPSAKRRPSTETPRGPVKEADARSLLATLRQALKARTPCQQ